MTPMKAAARTYTMRARAEAVEATRERIARAAMQRFLAEPYDGVTIASVARDAGVSHQTLLNHFESKDGLFAAAAERFSADLAAWRAGRGLRGPAAVRPRGTPPHSGRAARSHRRLHLETATARPRPRPARHPADHDRHGPRDPLHDREGTMSRHYLFTLWDGSGTVPPELSLARALIERGHRVTVLADPTIEPEAIAAGADFRPWRGAPPPRPRRPPDADPRGFA